MVVSSTHVVISVLNGGWKCTGCREEISKLKIIKQNKLNYYLTQNDKTEKVSKLFINNKQIYYHTTQVC